MGVRVVPTALRLTNLVIEADIFNILYPFTKRFYSGAFKGIWIGYYLGGIIRGGPPFCILAGVD